MGHIKIVILGVIAFGFATAGGIWMAKAMNLFCKSNPINPLIGSAGVSAVPMAARVSQVEGQKADPKLSTHARDGTECGRGYRNCASGGVLYLDDFQVVWEIAALSAALACILLL
jgi:Na+-transporting methylmalonyl-CoA/oxaloacetate decarboxylase beta subunit